MTNVKKKCQTGGQFWLRLALLFFRFGTFLLQGWHFGGWNWPDDGKRPYTEHTEVAPEIHREKHFKLKLRALRAFSVNLRVMLLPRLFFIFGGAAHIIEGIAAVFEMQGIEHLAHFALYGALTGAQQHRNLLVAQTIGYTLQNKPLALR